jgi:hypothetical protein
MRGTRRLHKSAPFDSLFEMLSRLFSRECCRKFRKHGTVIALALCSLILVGSGLGEEKAKKPIKQQKAPFVHAVTFYTGGG